MAGPGIPLRAVARALYSLLSGQSPTLASGGVHQRIPPATSKPYIVVKVSNAIEDDTHTGKGHEVVAEVDVYSDDDSHEECAGILSSINQALDTETLTVTGYNFTSCYLDGAATIIDERRPGDVLTTHGNAKYRIKVRTP